MCQWQWQTRTQGEKAKNKQDERDECLCGVHRGERGIGERDKGGDKGGDVLDMVGAVEQRVCCVIPRLPMHLCLLCRLCSSVEALRCSGERRASLQNVAICWTDCWLFDSSASAAGIDSHSNTLISSLHAISFLWGERDSLGFLCNHPFHSLWCVHTVSFFLCDDTTHNNNDDADDTAQTTLDVTSTARCLCCPPTTTRHLKHTQREGGTSAGGSPLIAQGVQQKHTQHHMVQSDTQCASRCW